MIHRRIALNLDKLRGDLFKYPILDFVQDTSKTVLLHELELIYWYHTMKTYLKRVNGDPEFSFETLKLFFFQSAIYVKKVLLYQLKLRLAKNPMGKALQDRVHTESEVIACLMAYIKTYHY